MRTTLRIAVMVVLTVAGLAASDPAYVGKWMLNVDKSDFGQLTVTYEALPNDSFKATMDGQSYTFKMDGKETPTPWGNTAAWKKKGDKEWESTSKANGKTVSEDKLKLSDDGKTLTVESKVNKASGGSSDDTMTFQRVSGGPGLAGTWKAAKMKSDSPGTMEISAKGSDGLVLKFVDQGGVCEAKFDGKDYPATGKMWPDGWTCAIAKAGDRAFDVTWKRQGIAMYKSTFTASDDGKTLTETGGAANTKEKVKAVYDRK